MGTKHVHNAFSSQLVRWAGGFLRWRDTFSGHSRHAYGPDTSEAIACGQIVNDRPRHDISGGQEDAQNNKRAGDRWGESVMGLLYPVNVANEFIALSGGEGVTHMKLQKLVYLTLEDWLVENDSSFLQGDPEVWQYGPVFPDLYHELKHYRSQPITKKIEVFGAEPKVEDENIRGSILRVWDKYKLTAATRLSDLTHRPGGPWHQIAEKCGFKVPYGTSIPVDVIKKYVREKAKNLA